MMKIDVPGKGGGVLTRRTFLRAAGLGTGTVLLHPPALWAAGKKLPELRFLVVSDTHLGYRDQPHAARQWERTAAEVAALPGAFVLHLGDVVDRGREPQYPLYLQTRKKIGKPVYEIPGNHDPQTLFEKYIRKPVDTTVTHRWLRILLLNNSRTDSHDGFLSETQLDRIETECRHAARDDVYLMLAMHVPAHTNKHPDRGWYVKPQHGQTRLYDILRQYRSRVLCLLHGHFHNGIRGWDDHLPLHEIIFPSALYNLDRKLQQQKAPGYNLPLFRPGYTEVTLRAGKMELRYRPVGQGKPVGKTLSVAQTAR